jgi:diaminopimelate decarboxylase
VGRIVVDSHSEVRQLAALTAAAPAGGRQKVLVRVTPGVDAHVHPAVTTGTEDQKFGLSIASGAAADVAQRILRQPGLELAGVHCHIGSQIAALDGFEAAARRLVAFMAGLGGVPELNLGGGHAVPYRPGEDGLDITAFAERITSVVNQESAAHGIPVPRLTIEPGRAIVGAAGVTLYRVLTVKHGARTFVVVDGGMSDNPRPALYGSRYHIERAGVPAAAGTEPRIVVGRHCEAGDVLVPDARLPADIRPGDLLAVPCTGAYHHAMASNYNYLTRPPVIAVREGRAWPLVRRETIEDMLRRDVGLRTQPRRRPLAARAAGHARRT